MKHLGILFALVLGSSQTVSAQTLHSLEVDGVVYSTEYLLSLTSEKTGPSDVSRIGILLDNKNEIEGIFFEYVDKGEVHVEHHSLDQLSSRRSLVSYMGVKIVSATAESVTPQDLKLHVRYLYERSMLVYIGSDYHVKDLEVKFDVHAGVYRLYDSDSDKVISHANATNHMVDGSLKGIDEIKTW